MIEVSHKILQFQQGLLNQIRFKIKNKGNNTITYKIRCNNGQNYKLDPYIGLIESNCESEIAVKNTEAADISLRDDQFEIQYAEINDQIGDLREYWRNKKSQDNIILQVQVIDVHSQQKDQLIEELRNQIFEQKNKNQEIKEHYQKLQQKSGVDLKYFNQEGLSLGQVFLAIAIALIIGGFLR